MPSAADGSEGRPLGSFFFFNWGGSDVISVSLSELGTEGGVVSSGRHWGPGGGDHSVTTPLLHYGPERKAVHRGHPSETPGLAAF